MIALLYCLTPKEERFIDRFIVLCSRGELLIDLLYFVLKRRGSLINLKGQSNEILDLSIKNTGTARSQAKI